MDGSRGQSSHLQSQHINLRLTFACLSSFSVFSKDVFNMTVSSALFCAEMSRAKNELLRTSMFMDLYQEMEAMFVKPSSGTGALILTTSYT